MNDFNSLKNIKDLINELQINEKGNVSKLYAINEKIKQYKYDYNYFQLLNDFVKLKEYSKD